jgi:hypothetical protein
VLEGEWFNLEVAFIKWNGIGKVCEKYWVGNVCERDGIGNVFERNVGGKEEE